MNSTDPIAPDNGGEFAPYIDPKDGDISGTVLGFSKAPTKFQPDCVIVELQLADGTRRALWLTSTVLASQMAKVAPEIGERIHVSYKGKRQGASAEYHNFAVTAPDRKPFEPDWSALVDETFQP